MELKDKGTFPKDFDKGSNEWEYSQVNQTEFNLFFILRP